MKKYEFRQWASSPRPSLGSFGTFPAAGGDVAVASSPPRGAPKPERQRRAASESASPPRPELPAKPITIRRHDDLLAPQEQERIYDFLSQPGWKFGWKSYPKKDVYSFWHKHFAESKDWNYECREAPASDCESELQGSAPLMHAFWEGLREAFLPGHRLVRCYANAFAYGCDGTLHTDATSPSSFTTIYYPNPKWQPNWGGETMFFNADKTDILAAVYPKPNRLITFPGALPHAARGVSRACPVLRITLMFKTEFDHDRAGT